MDEDALHHNAALLDAAGGDHQHHHNDSDADHQRIGEAGEEVDDVEDEGQGYDEADKYRKQQRHTVDAALYP